MEKINITLDVTSIPKEKIVERSFTTADGQQVTKKELKAVIVPLKEKKFIKEGPGWKMNKTHFIAVEQTPAEREAKAHSTFIGEGIMFENTETSNVPNTSVDYPQGDVAPEDIPF